MFVRREPVAASPAEGGGNLPEQGGDASDGVPIAVHPLPSRANAHLDLDSKQHDGLSDSEIQALVEVGEVGFLHSFDAGSGIDGPGLRAVLWTAGCHFRCVYCHNPDTWKVRNGRLATVDDTMGEIVKYRRFWRNAAGGVTVSGGEPLVQTPFVRRIFRACKRLGIHTALDTNGALGAQLSDADLLDIDLVLLDLKAYTPQAHLRVTGQAIDRTLAFAARLAALGRPTWVRYVLVPGFTDDPAEIDGVAALAATWPNVARVEVLPFHQLGKFKWERMGIAYSLSDTESPSRDALAAARARFRAAGLRVVV